MEMRSLIKSKVNHLLGRGKRFRGPDREELLRQDAEAFSREYLKKAVLSYPPRHLTICITSVCNNRCVFCAYHSRDAAQGASNVYGLKYQVSLDEFKRMVDLAWAARVPKVHICSSGEPFLHPDVLGIMDYCIEVYGHTSIQTNFHREVFRRGNYLEEVLRRKDRITKITTDLLAGDPDLHNELKKGSSYHDVLDAMEYLSARSDLFFEAHLILTKQNFRTLEPLIRDLARRKINCYLAIVNLDPYDFNEYTRVEMQYLPHDEEMTEALRQARKVGQEVGIKVQIPEPVGSKSLPCGAFWSRLQTWPTRGIPDDKLTHNAIMGGCGAAMVGDLKTIGYVLDYDDLMDLWNNPLLVEIRANLIDNIYPDNECSRCQSFQPGGVVRIPENRFVD